MEPELFGLARRMFEGWYVAQDELFERMRQRAQWDRMLELLKPVKTQEDRDGR